MPETANVVTAVKQEKQEAPLVGAPAVYLDDLPETIPYKLRRPFRLGATEYRDVLIHRLNGKSISAVSRATREGIDAELAMWSAMMKIPLEAVEAMDSADITAVTKLARDFLPQEDPEETAPTGGSGANTQQT